MRYEEQRRTFGEGLSLEPQDELEILLQLLPLQQLLDGWGYINL